MLPTTLASQVGVPAIVLLFLIGCFGFVIGQLTEDYMNRKYGIGWSPMHFVMGASVAVILVLLGWIFLPHIAQAILGKALLIHWFWWASLLAIVIGFAFGLSRTLYTYLQLQQGMSGIANYRSADARQRRR